MRAKKIYRALHTLSLTISVKVDGQNVFCEFEGGMLQPRRLNGSYATSNEKIQKALESHPMFNSEFKIVKVVPLQPENKPQEQKEEEIQIQKEENPQAQVVEAAPAEQDHKVSEARTGQDAKEELNKKYGVPWSRLKNIQQVRKEATDLGIVYPKWNT